MKTNRNLWMTLSAALLLAVPFIARSQSQVPAAINYQGHLTDTLGNPLGSGYYEIEFRIWDDAVQNGAGNLVWGRSFPLHVVTNGLFNVLLTDDGGAVNNPTTPTNTLLSAFGGPDRYLGLTITTSNGVTVGSPSEISPRTQLASAPFAIQAQTANTVAPGGVSSASLAPGSVTQGKLASSAVTTGTIANGAVTAVKLASNVALLDRNHQTFTGENNFSSITQSERLRLSGQEFFQDGHTDTNGLSLLLGVNRTDNRQLWIADSGRLEGNSSNPTLRLWVSDVAGVDSIATDGKTLLPLSLGANKSVVISPNGNVGIGTNTPSSRLHVNGSMTVDGSMTVENGAVSMFGARTTLTLGTAYTAPSDGFVTFHAYHGEASFSIWDAGGALMLGDSYFYNAAGADTAWFTMPVAKGEHFRWAASGGGAGNNVVYWWRSIGKNVGTPAVYNP